MSFDRPRQSDVPFISHTDPLPSRPQPQGRWGEPYRSQDGVSWRCSVRRPLTKAEKSAGLRTTVIARDLAELERLKRYEDEKAERFGNSIVPAHQHRATG